MLFQKRVIHNRLQAAKQQFLFELVLHGIPFGQLFDIVVLTKFFAQNNNLTSISSKIGNLTNLEFINLSHNKITKIPSEIDEIDSLDYFDVSYNKITSVPKEIGNLTTLYTLLNLSNNSITKLPSTIGNYPQLNRMNYHE